MIVIYPGMIKDMSVLLEPQGCNTADRLSYGFDSQRKTHFEGDNQQTKHKRTFLRLKEIARFFGNDGLWWWRSRGVVGQLGAEVEEGTDNPTITGFLAYILAAS